MNDVHFRNEFRPFGACDSQVYDSCCAGTTPGRQLAEVLPGGHVARSLAGSDDVTIRRWRARHVFPPKN